MNSQEQDKQVLTELSEEARAIKEKIAEKGYTTRYNIMIDDNEFKILNNGRTAICVYCEKPITTNRKVKIANKRYHLSCMLKRVEQQIANTKSWVAFYKKRRAKILRLKDYLALEEITK